MRLDKHGTFAGCNVSLEVFTAAKPDILSTLTSRMLNLKSDTTGDERLRPLVRVLKRKVSTVAAHRDATAAEMPAGLYATQMMPVQSFRFLSTMHKYYTLYESCRKIARSMWLVV